ncbi:MAG: NifB/NifX family molybdenum-iron cluster-binding protein [Thermodesulfobacteriota bacterium]|nr:NifB/NifX family molybdenum-iron cluster-binding protein [Thermodesulfobacteriota bacterium]
MAIPVFGRWISPRFGFSPEMWILTVENGEVVFKEKISMVGFTLFQWFKKLSSSGVNTLICGGIDEFCCRQLEGIGISIIPEVSGEVDETVDLFLRGRLRPGLRGCNKEFRGGRRRKGRFSGPPWVKDE